MEMENHPQRPALRPTNRLPMARTPNSFPPWQTVYEYHRRFCELGIWEKLNTELRIYLRLLEKRNAQPSAVVFDTQSVKALSGGEERGFDGYKRVNGRKREQPVRCYSVSKKRFLLVDTLGLLLLVKVVPGNKAETKAAMFGLERVNEVFDMVELAWADQGFGGEPLRLWMKQELGWDLELTGGISKPGKADFEVAPRRWVVERTIA
jgi:putative transposase